jgi:hypothetical protein
METAEMDRWMMCEGKFQSYSNIFSMIFIRRLQPEKLNFLSDMEKAAVIAGSGFCMVSWSSFESTEVLFRIFIQQVLCKTKDEQSPSSQNQLKTDTTAVTD